MATSHEAKTVKKTFLPKTHTPGTHMHTVDSNIYHLLYSTTDEMAKGLACLPLEREIVSSTRSLVIPKTIIKMVPTAVWQGMLQYTDISRESNSRGYQLTSPQL
jgi:hypothetical protein